jgi:hypothetical protein
VTNSIVVGYRVALAPDRLQGRVQAASTLISFSAGWLGPLFVGFMLQNAGSTATIVALTGWAGVLALVATASRAFRHPPTFPACYSSPCTRSSVSSAEDMTHTARPTASPDRAGPPLDAHCRCWQG